MAGTGWEQALWCSGGKSFSEPESVWLLDSS